MSSGFRVEIRAPGRSPREITVDPSVEFGREGDLEVLDDAKVSRRHLRLEATAHGLVATDLGSSNGTFVDGVRITEATALAPGASLRIGDTDLIFIPDTAFIADIGVAGTPAEVRPALSDLTASDAGAAVIRFRPDTARLAWAIEQRFDVISLSLGTTRRDWALPFYELCDEAYFHKCFVVTAANNVTRPSFFPSLCAAVASIACNLATDPWRFHYNPEPPTEFLARGIDVEVPWLDGSFTTGTGNSYAAPHIAGLAALIRSKHPELRPFQVKTVLSATAANAREAPEIAGRLRRVLRTPTTSARASAALRRIG